MAFTVEFNNDGTINQVFKGGVGKGSGTLSVIQPHDDGMAAMNMPGQIPQSMIANLRGKSVSNITSVTILTTENPTVCIVQGGKLYCFPKP